jgi:hypothetical protein
MASIRRRSNSKGLRKKPNGKRNSYELPVIFVDDEGTEYNANHRDSGIIDLVATGNTHELAKAVSLLGDKDVNVSHHEIATIAAAYGYDQVANRYIEDFENSGMLLGDRLAEDLTLIERVTGKEVQQQVIDRIFTSMSKIKIIRDVMDAVAGYTSIRKNDTPSPEVAEKVYEAICYKEVWASLARSRVVFSQINVGPKDVANGSRSLDEWIAGNIAAKYNTNERENVGRPKGLRTAILDPELASLRFQEHSAKMLESGYELSTLKISDVLQMLSFFNISSKRGTKLPETIRTSVPEHLVSILTLYDYILSNGQSNGGTRREVYKASRKVMNTLGDLVNKGVYKIDRGAFSTAVDNGFRKLFDDFPVRLEMEGEERAVAFTANAASRLEEFAQAIDVPLSSKARGYSNYIAATF